MQVAFGVRAAAPRTRRAGREVFEEDLLDAAVLEKSIAPEQHPGVRAFSVHLEDIDRFIRELVVETGHRDRDRIGRPGAGDGRPPHPVCPGGPIENAVVPRSLPAALAIREIRAPRPFRRMFDRSMSTLRGEASKQTAREPAFKETHKIEK